MRDDALYGHIDDVQWTCFTEQSGTEMAIAVRGVPNMTAHPGTVNMDATLELIDGSNVVRERRRPIFVHAHHLLAIIGELQKDTAKKCNRTRGYIEVFITQCRYMEQLFIPLTS